MRRRLACCHLAMSWVSAGWLAWYYGVKPTASCNQFVESVAPLSAVAVSSALWHGQALACVSVVEREAIHHQK